MPLVPENFHPSRTPTMSCFSLAVLSPAFAEQDFKAVQASADSIRHVFGPANYWPPSTITFEENKSDLARHEAEFNTNQAFAYAVLGAEQGAYLGCFYLKPIKSRFGRNRQHELFDAQAFLWMSVLGQNIAEAVVQADISRWLAEQWPFRAVAWPGRVQSWQEWDLLAATPSAA